MIYYATLIALFALGFYNVFSDNQKYVSRIFFFSLCWLVLHDGLRWFIATDWDVYYRFFRYCLLVKGDAVYFEPGYVLLNKIVRTVTDQYTVFLLLHAVIVYSLIGSTIYKYAAYPLLSLALLYAMMLGYLGMNRQYIALAISFYSIRFIFNRQPYPFIACMVLSMLFHNGALLFSIAYFLNRPFKRIVYIVSISLFLAIAVSGLIRKLPLELFYLLGSDLGDKADKYAYEGSKAIPLVAQLMGIAKRMIWVLIILIYFDAFKKVKYFSLFFNLYFVSLCIYLLFNNTLLQVIVNRGALPFNIFEILIVPMTLYVFKDNATRKIYYLAFFAYGLMTMTKGINGFIESSGVDIFNPYRCVLFE